MEDPSQLYKERDDCWYVAGSTLFRARVESGTCNDHSVADLGRFQRFPLFCCECIIGHISQTHRADFMLVCVHRTRTRVSASTLFTDAEHLRSDYRSLRDFPSHKLARNSAGRHVCVIL